MDNFLINNFAVLNPKGFIASEQKDLIFTVVSIMLIAVIPALVMTYTFAWKYRASRNSTYQPNFDQSKPLQFAWLGLLCGIIVVLAVIAWKGAHALDPRKPIDSNVKPITIQVVALEWKWLFIYPEQNIATVNYVQMPEDTPIVFEITADAPMNSFWIPQLGGQMYAMNGMRTKLHLIANEQGTYRGQSSNISGEGFSGMTFSAKATSSKEFQDWVESAKKSDKNLTATEYENLSSPSKNNPPTVYSSAESNLFTSIVMKFMANPNNHTLH